VTDFEAWLRELAEAARVRTGKFANKHACCDPG